MTKEVEGKDSERNGVGKMSKVRGRERKRKRKEEKPMKGYL